MSKKQLILSNGCTASYPSVTPKNWKTGGKELLIKDWRIQYYFHDPRFQEKHPKGKQVRIKGMNEFKSLTERRIATESILSNVVNDLHRNYNPITESYQNNSNVIDEFTLFPAALEFAYEGLNIIHTSKLDYRSALNYINKSIDLLGLKYEPIKNISRRNIKQILKHQQDVRGLSNNRYNKYLAYLSRLFDELIEFEVLENNPTYKIKKLPVNRSIRETVTDEQRVIIHRHLKENYYTFWRYMTIFYASGARSSELLRIRVKDINFAKLEYKVLIKKGNRSKEVIKPINVSVSYLWKELLDLSDNNSEYLFSLNLEPGENPITRPQITRRWREHVKKKLGVTADFYSLKHLNLDDVVENYSISDASSLASHTSNKMVQKHYAVNEKQRQLDRLKKINISFVKEEKPSKETKVVKLRVV